MVRVELAASCKLDKPSRDCFPEYFAEIALVAIPESYARHFESDAYHPLGLRIEPGALQKLRDWHDRFRYRPWNVFAVRVSPVTGRVVPTVDHLVLRGAIGFSYGKSEQRSRAVLYQPTGRTK